MTGSMKNFYTNNKDLVLVAVIVACITVIFSFSLHYPILSDWDDQYYILNNKHLGLSPDNILFWIRQPYYHMYIPLTMFSYMFDYSIWKYNSFGYHLQNIFWHLVTAVLIYKSFRIFKINPCIAFFTTLIFSIHPQRVESVTWLSERKDVLCTAFYFASVYFYLRKKHNSENFPYLSFTFYILALLAKPMAITIPFILLFIEFYRRKQFKCKYYCQKLWLYFAVLIVFLPMTFTNQAQSANKFILSKQIYITFFNILWYIKKTLIPVNLNPIYPVTNINDTFNYLLTAYILIFVFIIIFAVRNRKVFLFVFVPLTLCYLVSLAPVSGFIPWGSFDKTDHWSYIPSAFIWFSIALILSQYLYKDGIIISNKYISGRIVFPVLAIFSVFTGELNILYQEIWQSTYLIYQRAASFYPANNYALWCYGATEILNGNYLQAAKTATRMSKSDNIADKLRADYLTGTVMFLANKPDKALAAFSKITRIKPELAVKILITKNNYTKALSMTGDCLVKLNKPKKAIIFYKRIIKLYPENSLMNYYFNGMICLTRKNYNKALSYFEKAHKLDTTNKAVNAKLKEIREKY